MAIEITPAATGRKVFEEQTFRHLDGLYRTALYLLDSQSDAKDVVVRSFVKAYRTRDENRFGPGCRVRMFRTMVKILPGEYRPSLSPPSATVATGKAARYSASSRPSNRQPNHDPGSDPGLMVTGKQVGEAIRDIPREFRLIVVLFMIEGFSYGEIADIAAIDREKVRMRLGRGRKFMLARLIGYEESENIKTWRSAGPTGADRTDEET